MTRLILDSCSIDRKWTFDRLKGILDQSKLVKLNFPKFSRSSFQRFFTNKQLSYEHNRLSLRLKLNSIDVIALKFNLTYLILNLNNIITPISVFMKQSFQQPCKKLIVESSNIMKLLSLIPKLTKHVIRIRNWRPLWY